MQVSFPEILFRPHSENAKVKISLARELLLKVMKTLEHTGPDISLDNLLKEASIPFPDYNEALKIALRKNALLLKRTPTESLINPYNPIILRGHGYPVYYGCLGLCRLHN